MKKAFTLVEMLIVVAVLATLMTLVFNLVASNDEQARRVKTIIRLQRLENCLSGYYAAFGSYPPVALHGSRDIFQKVNEDGVQKTDGSRSEDIWDWDKIGEDNEKRAWAQVNAACRSQPVISNFPFSDRAEFQDMVDNWSLSCQEAAESADGLDEKTRAKIAAGFTALRSGSSAAGELNRYRTMLDWRSLQLFRFGLTSYILPRYILMTSANSDFYQYSQWTQNNTEPHDPYTGQQMTWNQIANISKNLSDEELDGNTDMNNNSRYGRILNIPSQKVCPRWLPNLEGICDSAQNRSIYGIQITEPECFPPAVKVMVSAAGETYIDGFPECFTPGDAEGNRDQYILDHVTVRDGWNQEFYYYSPSPHQRYQLWSAGPNLRTFPPWVAREDLSQQANDCVRVWTRDDIMQLSN